MQRTLDKQFRSFTQQVNFIIVLKNSKLFRHPWTLEEDIILLGEFLNFGRKWTEISKLFQGRNVYSVKNRFCGFITKFRLEKNSDDLKQHIQKIMEELLVFKKKQRKTYDDQPLQLSQIFIPISKIFGWKFYFSCFIKYIFLFII